MNYIVTCKRDGVKLLEKRYTNQSQAANDMQRYMTDGASIILDDCRQHVTFDSVELNVFETVYDMPVRKGGAA